MFCILFSKRDCHDACDGLYLRQSYISCLREATALLPIRAQRGAGATAGCNHHGRPKKSVNHVIWTGRAAQALKTAAVEIGKCFTEFHIKRH